MSIRNLAELGKNLKNIMTRLISNQNLMKLLYYTDPNPLNGKDLSKDEIDKLIFNKLIKIVPRVGPLDNETNIVTIRVMGGDRNIDNTDFRTINIAIDIFVPLTQWIIVGEDLRIFAIIGEIEKSLNGKNVTGIGRLEETGFELTLVTDEMSGYTIDFEVQNYE